MFVQSNRWRDYCKPWQTSGKKVQISRWVVLYFAGLCGKDCIICAYFASGFLGG